MFLKEEQDRAANVYATEKYRNKAVLSVIGAVALTGVLVWQILDFFVLKNGSALCWTIVTDLVKDTELIDNKTDVFMGLGACICMGIVCVVDKKVINFLFDDEVKERYINKVKRKFISHARKIR